MKYVRGCWNDGRRWGDGISIIQQNFFNTIVQIVGLLSRKGENQEVEVLDDDREMYMRRKRMQYKPLGLFKGPVLRYAKQAMIVRLSIMDRAALGEHPLLHTTAIVELHALA